MVHLPVFTNHHPLYLERDNRVELAKSFQRGGHSRLFYFCDQNEWFIHGLVFNMVRIKAALQPLAVNFCVRGIANGMVDQLSTRCEQDI